MMSLIIASGSSAALGPIPPCSGPVAKVEPAYGAQGARPRVGTWNDVTLALEGGCPDLLDGPARLVVALSSRFIHDGTVQDLAARVGSVSALEGLRYWSVTDSEWRVLISQSHALAGSEASRRRSDFSASEVLSGQTLFMAQRDTRSNGVNVYALAATAPTEDQLVVSIINLNDIRLLLATLFERQALVSTHFFTRLQGNEWGYYSLTAVKQGRTGGREASFINRAAAFERFLTGRRPDAEPPLAR